MKACDRYGQASTRLRQGCGQALALQGQMMQAPLPPPAAHSTRQHAFSPAGLLTSLPLPPALHPARIEPRGEAWVEQEQPEQMEGVLHCSPQEAGPPSQQAG